MDLRKAKPPSRKYEGLEVAGPGARRTDGRMKAMAREIRKLIDRLVNELLEEEISRLLGTVRKETVRERITRQMAQVLARGGVRQINDSGKQQETGFSVPSDFYDQYFQDKLVEVQGIEESIRQEFQSNLAKIIGRVTAEQPGISNRELANRLRAEVFLSGVDVKNPPSKAQLQALPTGPKITQNIYGRASLIAATELGRAANQGAIEAMRDTGDEYKMWLSRPKDGGRGHQEMNKVIVPINEPFILPDGTPMDSPHDPSAPLRHRIRCKCTVIRPPAREVARAKREGRL
jgi:hypothetical protein